jgi:phage terminase small subunit
MALTDKQELFIQEYLVDLNATQAAIRAGYSKKSANVLGHETLMKPYIRARIDELLNARAEKLELTADWVLQRLVAITDRCMKAEPVMKWDPEEKAMLPTGEYMFDSQGANKAVELIGKHLSMFKDKIEHSGSLGVTIENDIPRRKSS